MGDFAEDLAALGFRRAGTKRGSEWVRQANPYLQFSVHPQDDGTVLFTWELAIGEFMAAHGLQIGTNEALNLFLFPQYDSSGPAEVAFVVSEMERTEQVLASLDFVSPGG